MVPASHPSSDKGKGEGEAVQSPKLTRPRGPIESVFCPMNFCAKHLDGRAQEKKHGKACFKNLGDVMEADIIAVEHLSRFDERHERPVGGNATVAVLHTDMLVARILGKRICEPEFFRQIISRRAESRSTSLERVGKWGKGLSYKCRAVCLHPCGPKLALQVSDYFTHRHGLQHDLLTRAVLMRGGRWNIIRPGQDAKSTYKVKRIQHLKDVDDLVDVVDDILDPI